MQWIFWILAIILATGAGYIVFRADRRRNVPYPLITSVLRSIAWILVFSLLLLPSILITRQETEAPIVVILQDQSESVGIALQEDSLRYSESMEALADRIGASYKLDRWVFGAEARPEDRQFEYREQATDISTALAEIKEVYQGRNLGAIILASDGRFNQGVNPLHQSLALEAPVYTVGIGDTSVQRDLAITKHYVNSRVVLHSRFEVRADVLAKLARGYRGSLRLFRGSEPVGSSELYIASDAYDASISFQLTAEQPGVHHYSLQLLPMEGEVNLHNNRLDFFVEVVEEKRKLLLAAGAAHPDIRAIREALEGEDKYDITVVAGGKLPEDLGKFDAVVLHNISLNAAQIAALQRKPVWLILGDRMPAQILNSLQDAAVFEVGQINREVRAVLNPSFYQFLLPAGIRLVMDRMPPLHLNSGGIRLTPGADALFFQEGSGSTEPLWWFRQGERPVAVLAGVGIWRWRLYEYQFQKSHEVIDEAIRQTMIFLSTSSKEKPFRTAMSRRVWGDREPMLIQAWLLNNNREQVNTAEATLEIRDSAGGKSQYKFERMGNHYRLQPGILPAGNYHYTAAVKFEGTTYTDEGQFVVTTTSAELMESGADYALLYGLAAKYNGHFVPWSQASSIYDSIRAESKIKPVIHTVSERLPLIERKWLFILILLLLTTEWLLRKYWMAQ